MSAPPSVPKCGATPGAKPGATTGARFAAAAVRLAGLAGLRLGWSPDAFWRSTPADLAAVVAALTTAPDAATPPDPATMARLQEVHPDG